MNEVIRELHERKSVRAFEERPIPPEVRAEILSAAAQAPTAGNQMLYTILDITDQALKDRLAVTCDHQPFIARAPMVLIFLADCRRWLDAYRMAGCAPREPGEGDLLLAFSDANIAAQNAVTAAWSLGVGSCYIGDILENAEEHRKLLHLDEYVMPAAMLVFGYPTENACRREKPRRFRWEDGIVQENTYRPLTEEEQRTLFIRQREKEDVDDFLQKFHARKYASDFSLEMSRSAGVYLDAFRKNAEK